MFLCNLSTLGFMQAAYPGVFPDNVIRKRKKEPEENEKKLKEGYEQAWILQKCNRIFKENKVPCNGSFLFYFSSRRRNTDSAKICCLKM